MPSSTNTTTATPYKKSTLKNIVADDYTPSERKVQVIIQYMIVGGLLMLVMINARHFWFPGKASYSEQLAAMLTGVGYALLVGGACFGIGALVGFLFGIPRLLEANGNTEEGKAASGLAQNDNLVQISDWLTKIIVGVGLTQLSSLSDVLFSIGKTMSPSFGGTHPELGVNLAIGTVLYFTVIGFLSGYLWTRIHFYRLLAQTSGDVKSLEKKLIQVNEEKAQAEAEKARAEEERLAMEKQKQEAEAKMEEVKQVEQKQQKELKAMAKDNVKSTEMKTTEAMFISADSSDGDTSDDPHAGKFGGEAEQNGRKISATVDITSFDSERFFVSLEVVSTDSNKPLEGDVVFFLHPTFRYPERTVPVENGKAELDIVAWGAFTVGVKCDNGATSLELDLAKLPGAPQKFAER